MPPPGSLGIPVGVMLSQAWGAGLRRGDTAAVVARSSRGRCLRRRLLLGTAEGGGAVNLDEIKALAARMAELCRKYGIAELAVFGSVAGGDAGPDSDVISCTCAYLATIWAWRTST